MNYRMSIQITRRLTKAEEIEIALMKRRLEVLLDSTMNGSHGDVRARSAFIDLLQQIEAGSLDVR